MIRILIADSQELVGRATALLLSMASDMECVGQVGNGDEAVQLTKILRPDVVLMDVRMPIKSGVTATREITLAHPTIQVLVWTTLDDNEAVFEAVRAGALAFLLKDVSDDELLQTIRALRLGESRLTPPIAQKMLQHFARSADMRPDLSDPPPGDYRESRTSEGDLLMSTLTENEKRVLTLMADGASVREVADSAVLSEGTIRSYVVRIMQKLHANTRVERRRLRCD